MMLRGMYAEPGTFIGTIERDGVKLGLIVQESIAADTRKGCDVYLRPARRGEIDQGNMPDPRSVAEHESLPVVRTPYGPARMYGPRPEKRAMLEPGYLTRIREEKKIKVAQRRVRQELNHLYRLHHTYPGHGGR